MRKITEKAIEAFNQNKDLAISNTRVVVNGTVISLYLFDNLIAERTNGTLRITNAGWASNTTKERLNGLEGVSIS